MIDLDIEMTEKLCRCEIERAERSGESVNPYCLHHAPAHAMLELITRLRQAEKDAARYRWLRDEAANLDIIAPLVFMADEYGTSERVIDGPALDKNIDEVMQCEQ